MGIIIHQAQCGENNKKAWDLLKTTMSDITVAKSIAFKTDLQDHAVGVSWSPTVRGFMQNDYFLLMKSYPDKSPDVRPGRAFSHVLMISKEDIESIVDIGVLFNYLPSNINKSILLEPIKFNPKMKSGIKLSPSFEKRFNKVIHGFVRASEYKNTIIWVGEEAFEQAVYRLWQILSIEEKENLNFGINFNVDALPDSQLNFITTPENIENKFMNRGFCVIRRHDTQILTEISELILAGDITAKTRIQKFQNELETSSLFRTDIDRISIVIDTFEKIHNINNFKKLISLSHIVAEYSPDNKKGVVFKSKLIKKINQLLVAGDANQITILKNFKVDCFKGSEGIFTLSINDWITKHLFSVYESKRKNFSLLFKLLRESKSSNWWTKIFNQELKKNLAKINSDRASVIFNWLRFDFDIFSDIKLKIDSSKESEKSFVLQLPSIIDKSHIRVLKDFTIQRNWFILHAKLLLLEHPFEAAIEKQLEVDTELNSIEGLKIITKGVKPKSILDFTVKNGDGRLVKIAGNILFEDANYLNEIDFTNIHWQKVWLNSIQLGNLISDGFKEPQNKIFKLYDAIVDGYTVIEGLLQKISESDYSNILDYPKRNLIWIKLPSDIKARFLEKTSSALLEELSLDATFQVPDDKDLSDYILTSRAISDFLYFNRNNIKSVLPIFSTFTQFRENIIIDYIKNYFGSLDVVDSTQLGKLVMRRGYSSVAYVIYDKISSNFNFRYALAECYSLLDFFTKGIIKLRGTIANIIVTEDQWWSAFTELTYKLYSSGPTENKIWIQAGGNDYDLLTKGTGKEVWIAALQKLRKDECTGITIKKLLKVMVEEHPKNGELKTIRNLWGKL